MTVQLPSFSKMKFPNISRLNDSIGLVLASGSPRRKLLLSEIGLEFEVIRPDVEEEIIEGLEPSALVIELSRQKLYSLKHDGERAYLSCDTIVVMDGQILTKPINENDALRILRLLSGNTHSVFTGLALYNSKNRKCLTGFEESRVSFNNWEDKRLREYIATGEPLDKAGAYGIQGMGRFLVDTVSGNIDNVIGLPLQALDKLAGLLMDEYV